MSEGMREELFEWQCWSRAAVKAWLSILSVPGLLGFNRTTSLCNGTKWQHIYILCRASLIGDGSCKSMWVGVWASGFSEWVLAECVGSCVHCARTVMCPMSLKYAAARFYNPSPSSSANNRSQSRKSQRQTRQGDGMLLSWDSRLSHKVS